ncbi:peptidase domain-containing ABC transporter [Synechococcus sp. CBW1107]|uniref:peptidase domain-containing ABC transporter n=1 Tax=Synechococcus sp. CBW1107 TaxID=2789857 RepID=UPI002AD31B91|nr:peptidase domain-containing ABC transporter [Synechococcus sp. CBW1107]CAK6696027.1 Lactococcin-G-processing and transport ATP-binding protein LagD [Synechococcus sp. CBW1107]
MPRYACVEQHSEEDCGAACVATVARQHGRRVSLAKVREMVGTGSSGTTLLGLRRGADAIGFHARAVRAEPDLLDQLDAIPLPAICHWKGNHWVVLHGRRRRRYVIADPAVGVRLLRRDEFLKGWGDGVLLLLEPDLNRLLAQEEENRAPFMRFLRLVLPYRGLLLQALAINAVIGMLALAMPLLMQLLTDDVLVRRDTQLLTSLGLAMLLLFVFRELISLIQGHMVGHFAQRLQLGMVLEYGHRLFQLPMTYFDSHRSGEVVSRIADVSHINQLISDLVLGLPSQLFIACISMVVMLTYSPALTAASLVAFALLLGANLLFLPALRQKTRRLIVESAENQGFLVEAFRGAQVLKTTEALPQAWDEYQRNFGSLAHLRWSTMQLGLFSNTTTGLLSSITTLALLWYGSSFVIGGQLSIGQLLAFNGMGANVLGFLGGLVAFSSDYITGQVVFRRLSEVLEGTVEDPQAADKPWVTLPPGCEISCKDLTFHHAGRVELLKDFSLTIPGGRCTALIGESGCGKSTLVKLLSGLYPPQSGTIHYGPYSLHDISLECLRQQVALVPQDAQFFNRTILENFRFAYPDVTFEQVVAACDLALADEFIRELPSGYQTVLGEFGANLSGGQRQRLAIARALVAHPPVVIMDESTAALDPVLERRLMERLLLHRKNLTTVMISHRPSVIIRCDWVVYLERGRIKFQGRPEDLRETESLAPYLLSA